jgi:hypothetical protein
VAPDQPRLFRIGRDPRGWASLRSQARTVGEVKVHDADASSEPGCSRDQGLDLPFRRDPNYVLEKVLASGCSLSVASTCLYEALAAIIVAPAHRSSRNSPIRACPDHRRTPVFRQQRNRALVCHGRLVHNQIP